MFDLRLTFQIGQGLPLFFIIAKFSPNNTTVVRGISDPMQVFTDWQEAQTAAIAAQQQNHDGSSFAIFQAIAVTAFQTPQVTLNLIGATVPTTM